MLETNSGVGRCDASALNAFKVDKCYIEILQQTNGGKFKEGAHIKKGDGELWLRELLSLSPGHLSDITYRSELLNERWLPEVYMPIVSSWNGDYLFLNKMEGGIYYWDHELDDSCESAYVLVSENFEKLMSGIEFYPDESKAFEAACSTMSLEELRQTGFFAEDYASIFSEACRQGNLELVRQCTASKLPDKNVMKFAGMNGHIDVLKFLMSRGYDINEDLGGGRTLLDWVRWKPEYYDVVKSLGGVSGES